MASRRMPPMRRDAAVIAVTTIGELGIGANVLHFGVWSDGAVYTGTHTGTIDVARVRELVASVCARLAETPMIWKPQRRIGGVPTLGIDARCAEGVRRTRLPNFAFEALLAAADPTEPPALKSTAD